MNSTKARTYRSYFKNLTVKYLLGLGQKMTEKGTDDEWSQSGRVFKQKEKRCVILKESKRIFLLKKNCGK
jgi:hypothetical protein